MVENSQIIQIVLSLTICYALSRITVEAFREKDVIFELKETIEHIQYKQSVYENELLRQRKTIKEQDAEISNLRSFVQDFMATNTHQSQFIAKTKLQLKSHSTKSEHGNSDMVINGSVTTTEKQTENENVDAEADPILLETPHNLKSSGRVKPQSRSFGLKEVQKRQAGVIAFSAYLDHDVNIATNQVLKFNQIITNEGNGYNIHTGSFTCPEAGMYLLTFYCGERGGEFWTSLKINSVNIVDAVAETTISSQDLQGGNTVLVRLKTGDVVFIENGYGDMAHVEGSNGLRLSTFSGVLLYS